jgi:hypothetical protein
MVDQDLHQTLGQSADESPSTILIAFRVGCRGLKSRRPRGFYSTLVLLVAMTPSSCDGGMNDLAVRNGTDQVLVVSEVYENQDLDEHRLEPDKRPASTRPGGQEGRSGSETTPALR